MKDVLRVDGGWDLTRGGGVGGGRSGIKALRRLGFGGGREGGGIHGATWVDVIIDEGRFRTTHLAKLPTWPSF